MAKEAKPDIAPKEAKSEPMPQTGCVICGSYDAPLEQVTENARAHKACADSRPDVIAKVKARA